MNWNTISRFIELLAEEKYEDFLTILSRNRDLTKDLYEVIREVCSNSLREEIRLFAGIMELKMRKHDSKSWKHISDDVLFRRLVEHVEELKEALQVGDKVPLKAADVANYAMMLAFHGTL